MPNKTKMVPITHELQKFQLKQMLSRNSNWLNVQFLCQKCQSFAIFIFICLHMLRNVSLPSFWLNTFISNMAKMWGDLFCCTHNLRNDKTGYWSPYCQVGDCRLLPFCRVDRFFIAHCVKTHFSAQTDLTWCFTANFFGISSISWSSLYHHCQTTASTTSIYNLSQQCYKHFFKHCTIYQSPFQLVHFWLSWCHHRMNF